MDCEYQVFSYQYQYRADENVKFLHCHSRKHQSKFGVTVFISRKITGENSGYEGRTETKGDCNKVRIFLDIFYREIQPCYRRVFKKQNKLMRIVPYQF